MRRTSIIKQMPRMQMPVYQAANRRAENPFMLAFQLKEPRKIARVLAQFRMDVYCARQALLEARAAQPPAWQEEFDYWCRRWDVPLQ